MKQCAFAFVLLIPAMAWADVKDTLNKARNAFSEKRFDEALKLATVALEADPKSLEAHYLRGTVYMQTGKHESALKDFRKLLELAPDFAPAYDQIGTACFKLAMIDESLAAFDKFIELNPRAGPAHWRRGLTLYYAEKFDTGVKQFTTSDKEEPNDVENAVWHFLCNARVQGIEKARGEFLKVKQDPRGEYMMKIYQLFKGEAKPEDVYQAAEAGENKDALRNEQRFYANYYVGMYYECVKEPAKSLELLKKAVEKYPIGHYMMDVARVHIKLREKK